MGDEFTVKITHKNIGFISENDVEQVLVVLAVAKTLDGLDQYNLDGLTIEIKKKRQHRNQRFNRGVTNPQK